MGKNISGSLIVITGRPVGGETMKVTKVTIEIEIPDGKSCDGCHFEKYTDLGFVCAYLDDKELAFDFKLGDNIKHPGCPGLKGGG